MSSEAVGLLKAADQVFEGVEDLSRLLCLHKRWKHESLCVIQVSRVSDSDDVCLMCLILPEVCCTSFLSHFGDSWGASVLFQHYLMITFANMFKTIIMLLTRLTEALYLLWQVDPEAAKELWTLACNGSLLLFNKQSYM